ncbi:DUF692 domain-containing protein [Inhella gelatinilytica]|uniref:DUF692 domain-containing protein n=1 Tax=Inhella gelatinilytica TaxID=2795030 RepID=UPI0028738DBE|nr:DUF692 domain-containing protein [Inhella gelatinilytica]
MALAGGCGIGWRQPHYRQVLEDLPRLPFLEVHSENFFGSGGAAQALLRQARQHYPLSLHGVGLGLGSAAGVDPGHLNQLNDLVTAVEPWLVSDHACFGRVAGVGGFQHAADLLPIPFSDRGLNLLAAAVDQVQERLKRVIAIENLSAYLGWAEDTLEEPEFFNALTQRTGCQLLLDVNNLVVNAHNRGSARAGCCPEAWVRALRPGSVAEIHVAGHTVLADGFAVDDHGSRVPEPVWALYRVAIQHLGPVPTLVEWDQAVPELAVLVAEAARAEAEARAVLP